MQRAAATISACRVRTDPRRSMTAISPWYHDMARHNMSAPCRLPTMGEFVELNSNCDSSGRMRMVWLVVDSVAHQQQLYFLPLQASTMVRRSTPWSDGPTSHHLVLRENATGLRFVGCQSAVLQQPAPWVYGPRGSVIACRFSCLGLSRHKRDYQKPRRVNRNVFGFSCLLFILKN